MTAEVEQILLQNLKYTWNYGRTGGRNHFQNL